MSHSDNNSAGFKQTPAFRRMASRVLPATLLLFITPVLATYEYVSKFGDDFQDSIQVVHDSDFGLETFVLNAGLNDAWYNPQTSGQGFFITVFPRLGVVSLAWFTYDTVLPDGNATANLGDPGHRWLTALGMINGNQSVMSIEISSGGIFDTTTVITRVEDGTITLTFEDCNSATVQYDIPSINRQGTVPIQRVASDNIALCEALNSP